MSGAAPTQPQSDNLVTKFSQRSTNDDPRPSSWAVKSDNSSFEVMDCTRLKFVKPWSGFSENPHFMICTEQCIPEENDAYMFYWELEILEHADRDRCVAIGIGTERSGLNFLPGEPGSASYGYHSDDGKIYDMTGGKHSGRIFGTGDVVGCLVSKQGGLRTIRFTNNGEKIGQTMTLGEAMSGPLYPCAGFYTGPEAVGTVIRANFQAHWNPDCKSIVLGEDDV